MMLTIGRTAFVARLGEGVHVDRLTDEQKSALSEAGVGERELREIADRDRVIRGEVGLGELFRRLGARPEGLQIDDGQGSVTVGGRAFLALDRASSGAERIFAAPRLDVTLSVGADSSGQSLHLDAERQILSGLRARGFTPMSPSRVRALPSEERVRLGLDEARLDPSTLVCVKGDTVVRVVTAGDRALARALDRDAVVIHSGGGAPVGLPRATGLRDGARRADRPADQLVITDAAVGAARDRTIEARSPVRGADRGGDVLRSLDGILSKRDEHRRAS